MLDKLLRQMCVCSSPQTWISCLSRTLEDGAPVCPEGWFAPLETDPQVSVLLQVKEEQSPGEKSQERFHAPNLNSSVVSGRHLPPSSSGAEGTSPEPVLWDVQDSAEEQPHSFNNEGKKGG